MLRKVEEQPADADNYIQTPYGVAAVRLDVAPPADEDDALFGSPPATEPVKFNSYFRFQQHFTSFTSYSRRSLHGFILT